MGKARAVDMLAGSATMLEVGALASLADEIDLIGPARNGVAGDDPDAVPVNEVFGVLPVEFASSLYSGVGGGFLPRTGYTGAGHVDSLSSWSWPRGVSAPPGPLLFPPLIIPYLFCYMYITKL